MTRMRIWITRWNPISSRLTTTARTLALVHVLLTVIILVCFWTVFVSRPRSSRGFHPCYWEFVEICQTRAARIAKLNKEALDQKFSSPNKSIEFRRALTKHRVLHNKICSGQLPLKLMVFACRQPKCPALADGIRGMTLAYILALLSKRAFVIHAPEWIPFKQFFPAAFPFELEDCQAAQSLSVKQEIWSNLVDYTIPKDPDCTNMEKFGLLSESARVVSMVSNHLSECNYMLLRRAGFKIFERTHESISQLVFLQLFDFPGRTIGRHVDKFLRVQKISLDRTVCLHVRSGAFRSHSDKTCLQRNIDDVWRCARAMELSTARLSTAMNVTWLVIGDSDLHVDMVNSYLTDCSAADALFVGDKAHRRIIGTSTLGVIEHVRNAQAMAGNWQAMYRVFFDLDLLSRCLYLTASYSGYSGLAAAITLDWSQKKFFRVDRRSTPTVYMNEVCFQLMPY